MKLAAWESKYLIDLYWLHYYPELSSCRWTSEQVKSKQEIVDDKLDSSERRLYTAGLLVLDQVDIRTAFSRQFVCFEWRLEVSYLGATVIEPTHAVELILKLGDILGQLGKNPSLTAWQNVALKCRPASFVTKRIMDYISVDDLPELLCHDHEYVRGLASIRLVTSPDEGHYVYQYLSRR